MEVDDPEIFVVDREKLAAATKDWLKMLFNWILTGFNSSLTDLDIENITQFMIKYVTTDEEVETLMNTCIDVMKTVEVKLFDGDENTPVLKKDGDGNPPIVLPVESEEAKKSISRGTPSRNFSSYEYQKDRKACLKKVATLTRILSSMVNYLVKNLTFFKSVTDYFCALIQRANKETLKFIPKDKEFQIGDLTDVEPPKSEYEIFQDIVDNCLTLVITGYGIYTLSNSTKEQVELARETQSLMKKAEEDKQQVRQERRKDESGEDQPDKAMNEEALIYPDRVLAFVTDNSKVSCSAKQDVEAILSSWNEQLSQSYFNTIALTLIEHAGDNFDLSFTQSSFKKLMYLLLKLLENQENSEIFLQKNWFRKLLNIKSKFKHKDSKL